MREGRQKQNGKTEKRLNRKAAVRNPQSAKATATATAKPSATVKPTATAEHKILRLRTRNGMRILRSG